MNLDRGPAEPHPAGADGLTTAFILLFLVAGWIVLGTPTVLFLAYACIVALVAWSNRPLTLRNLAGKATPEDLGWIRIVVCLALLVVLLSDDTVSIHLIPEACWKGPRGEGPSTCAQDF